MKIEAACYIYWNTYLRYDVCNIHRTQIENNTY